MFIPPAGAMQFVAERNTRGERLASGDVVIWVEPHSSKCRLRGCSRTFKVIYGTMPLQWIEEAKKQGVANWTPTVCLCSGRIIE